MTVNNNQDDLDLYAEFMSITDEDLAEYQRQETKELAELLEMFNNQTLDWTEPDTEDLVELFAL